MKASAAQKTPSLHGASVVLTRPVGQQAGLARAVRARGGTPVSLPGLSLRAAPDADAVRAQLRAARNADVVIYVSPAAVRHAWRLLPDLRHPARTTVAAVGRATAAALRRRGCTRVVVPDTSQDAAGLLATPPLQRLRGRSVALIGAPGGREVLPATLHRRGAKLTRIAVYERAAPRWTRRHYAALEVAAKPWLVLASSGEALAHLATGLPAGLVLALRRAELIVSSERLADLAARHGFEHVHCATSALAPDLLDAAAGVLTRHRL